MEEFTEAGKTAYGDDDKRKCDEQIKKILAIKIFLAHILKDCLEEFKDYDPYDIADKFIEGEPEVSTEAVHERDKEVLEGMDRDGGVVRYDILFYAYVPSLAGNIKLIINVEAQTDFKPKYPLLKRAVYYCARMISDQHGKEFTNSKYGEIKKVVSIWLCSEAPKNKQNTITRFSMKEQNIVGNAKFNFAEYDLLDIVMVCLGSKDSENYKNCLKLIDVITSEGFTPEERLNVMKNDFNIKITKQIEEEVTTMCNMSYGIEKRAHNLGKAEGIEEGRAEGRKEGRAEGRKEGRAEGRKEGRAEGRKEGRAEGRVEGRAEGIVETLANSIKAMIESGQFSFDSAFSLIKAPADKYNVIKEMVMG